MNEFYFHSSFLIYTPPIPFRLAEPHIAIVLRETLVVKHFKGGGLINKYYYHGIYICISAISKWKKKRLFNPFWNE